MNQDFQLQTPVVLIIFKRPHTTEKVFAAIRQIKPAKLFVIADGPRLERSGEKEKCEATRAIIEQVDWECEVLKDYSDVNLGCGKRVYSGLNWVFSQVEEAIILEDDCIPDHSFFPFCEELLKKYQNDNRITSISAQNVQLGHQRTNYSYYFSRYAHCWGWATWRRAWQLYDFEMKYWDEAKNTNLLQQVLMDSQAVKYWTELFQLVKDGYLNVWAYQWLFTNWLQSGLAIIPNVNLVENIGFDADSTHLKKKDNKTIDMPMQTMEFPLKHPPFVIRNSQADEFAQRIAYEGGWYKRLKASVKKILKKQIPLKTLFVGM
jgi:hypothetical protein